MAKNVGVPETLLRPAAFSLSSAFGSARWHVAGVRRVLGLACLRSLVGACWQVGRALSMAAGEWLSGLWPFGDLYGMLAQ